MAFHFPKFHPSKSGTRKTLKVLLVIGSVAASIFVKNKNSKATVEEIEAGVGAVINSDILDPDPADVSAK